MQSCRAVWPEMDWDSGLWCECSGRAFWPEMDRQWPAMHSLCCERQAMRSRRQWPAIRQGRLLEESAQVHGISRNHALLLFCKFPGVASWSPRAVVRTGSDL